VNASIGAAWPEVIVPIHDGVAALAGCLASLRRTLPPDARLQLVDDASPDPRVAELLRAFAAAAPCELAVHTQARNLGFVASANAAMARAHGDVILLNSDTVATPGWLQRLAACALAVDRLATATPWSNNAEICSFPQFCVANPVPADPDAIAAAAARMVPEYPELPTAVGFCMLIRRAALDAIGDFDAETFGLGYGEENDFCRRAAAHGWRNVLCDDAYVAHVGGQSFAPLGLAPGGENLNRLVARYPRYNTEVADFIARDPLAPRRAALAAQLVDATAGAAT